MMVEFQHHSYVLNLIANLTKMNDTQREWMIFGTAVFCLGIIAGFCCSLLFAGQVLQPRRYEIVIGNDTHKAYGLNSGSDDFIFIPTDDRGVDEIARTAVHEVCHEMVWDDYKHFCGGK